MTQHGVTRRAPEDVPAEDAIAPAADVARGDAELEVIGVTKQFHARSGAVIALHDVSLTIRRKEFVTLVGRSGCGKTTLLRILAGLTHPSRGQVLAGGRPLWQDGRRDPATVDRIGVVFQDPNLFPWYTVEENVALPLKLRGVGSRERLARAHELCEIVGLSGFERSHPRELSGGMRQRVAIARALSYRPGVLLMDEPFGALDALTREKMNLELQALASASESTVVLVTHSIREAVFLADRVVLLSPRPGRIRSITSVGFTRPRQLDVEADPGFQAIIKELRRQLDEER